MRAIMPDQIEPGSIAQVIARRLTADQIAALRDAMAGEYLEPERRDLLTQPAVYWTGDWMYCPALLVESWAGGIRRSSQHVTIAGRAVAEALT